MHNLLDCLCTLQHCMLKQRGDAHSETHAQGSSLTGSNDPANLIALYPTCHEMYHKGMIHKASTSIAARWASKPRPDLPCPPLLTRRYPTACRIAAPLVLSTQYGDRAPVRLA